MMRLRDMVGPAVEVIPRLWLGCMEDRRDADFLQRARAGLVVECNAKANGFAIGSRVVGEAEFLAALRAPWDNSPDTRLVCSMAIEDWDRNFDVSAFFDLATKVISLGHGRDGGASSVFVHCEHGMSRLSRRIFWQRAMSFPFDWESHR